MKKILIALLPIMAVVASCTVEPPLGLQFGCEDVEADIRISCRAELPVTRSSCLQGESDIVDWNLYAYRDGGLYAWVYSDSTDFIRLKLGEDYRFYVLANSGRVAPPVLESDIATMRFAVDGLGGLNSGGLPMYYRCITARSVSSPVELLEFPLTRLVARYDVSIDTSGLDRQNFTLTSMKLCQAPLDIVPFDSRSAATVTGDCDYASAADVDSLNASRTVSLYMLENCQGILPGGNTDEWLKLPDNDSVSEDLSTFLEVCGVLSSPGCSADVRYRMYLGRDNIADFNVFRNTVNSLNLVLTDEGATRVSWKVSLTNVVDSRVLRFTKDTIITYSDHLGVSLMFDAEPSGVQYYLEADPDEMSAGDFSFTEEMHDMQRSRAWLYGGKLPFIKCDRADNTTPSVKVRLYTWDGICCGETTVLYDPAHFYHFDLVPKVFNLDAGTTRWIRIVPLPDIIRSNAFLQIQLSNPSVATITFDYGMQMFEINGLQAGSTVVRLTVCGTPQVFVLNVN